MARKVIVKMVDMESRRARAWAAHYDRRARARAMLESGFQARGLVAALSVALPAPALDADGASLQVDIDQRAQLRRVGAMWGNVPADLLNWWYWSESGWMAFVRAIQALPEVTEDYYWTGDKRRDVFFLAPVSTARRGRRAVHKPVDSKCASAAVKVQVPQFSTVEAEA